MTSKFDQLLKIINTARVRPVSTRPYGGLSPKAGKTSKYGVDPVNTEEGEFNISSDLDSEEYKRLTADEEPEEYVVGSITDRFGRVKKEPEDEELASIEAASNTRSNKYNKFKKELEPETVSSMERTLKRRQDKYRDGFKMMGRDSED